jgi:ubiquinone/menaquinone biosynthesis C-methylase UbiE
MNNAITYARFKQAQKYESDYWVSRSRDAVGIIHDLESPFALAQHLQTAGYLDKIFNRFLDVGVGGLGLGILWLVRAKEKYGLDSLPVIAAQTEYEVVDRFVQQVQTGVKYVVAQAEKMPFEAEMFDFIVCNNVLDHVQNPHAILGEIKRCLAPNGLFGFSVDTRSVVGLIERKILKKVRPNYGSLVGHPYEWTEKHMTAILQQHGFAVESHRPRPIKGSLLGGVRRSTWLLRHA